jgi:hypothetical protein
MGLLDVVSREVKVEMEDGSTAAEFHSTCSDVPVRVVESKRHGPHTSFNNI